MRVFMVDTTPLLLQSISTARSLSSYLRTEGLDATEICHVNLPPFNYRRMALRLGELFVFFHGSRGIQLPRRRLAAGEDQARPLCCERLYRFKSNAVVGSRSNDPFSSQISTWGVLVCEKGAVSSPHGLE